MKPLGVNYISMESVAANVSEEKQPVLKNKNFLLIWLGSTLYYFTFNIFTLALPLMIYDLTKSTFSMSAMRAIEFLPNILLAVFIGVITDRFHRKKVLLGAVGIKTLSIGAIFLMLVFTELNLWLLYLLGFILYTSSYTFGNAYHSIMPIVVKREQLTEVNSYLTLTRQLNSIIGPPFAGLVLLVTSYKYSISITLIGLIILMISVSLLNIPEMEKKVTSKRKGVFAEIKEGWDCLTENRYLWSLTIIVCISNIAASLTFAVFIYYALDAYQIGKVNLGLIISSSALGGIVSAIIAKKLLKWFTRGMLILYSLIISGIGFFVLFSLSHWLGLAVGLFFIGFSGTLSGIYYSTLRQESTPNHLLGRVTGTTSMIMKLAVPFSFLLGGALGEFILIQNIFFFSFIVTLFTIVYFWWSKSYKLA